MLRVGHESLGKVVEIFDFRVFSFRAWTSLVLELENFGHV